jgi:hypothetical protein
MKPVVRFLLPAQFFPSWTSEGEEQAEIYALDHPRLGRGRVFTTNVLKKFEDGSFETLNTMYKSFWG